MKIWRQGLSAINALKVQLAKASAPLYAVLDGAKFDDLPNLLFENDLPHKPLYRDMGSELREVQITTPQLIRFDTWKYWENDLTPAQRIDALLQLIDDLSAAVFWECEGEPKRLFRHLRTINNVMIQRDADTPPMPDPLDPEGETFGNTNTHQQVLFRHADANVMAQVLPVLSTKQLTRFMGPAQAVIFAPEAEWRLNEPITRIDNPKDTYNATHPLKLSQENMDGISERRIEVLRFNVAEFLKDMCPEETRNLKQPELYEIIIRSEIAADEIGISTESGYQMWAYFALMTNGLSLSDANVRDHFINSKSPDKIMKQLSQRLLELETVTVKSALAVA